MVRKFCTHNKDLLLILGAAFLAIFAKFWEPGIGISTTGYGSLAKNILEDGNWFYLHEGKGLFDPFVDHPFFIIWMNAVVFKIFGVTAQSVRILSSVMALGVFASLYTVVRRHFNEAAAAMACMCLLTVNVFMNFTSSGWLDLPMIGLVWIGFAILDKGIFEKKQLYNNLGAFILGLAVLGKGVSAVAVVPILLWAPFQIKKARETFFTYLSFLLPIALFTYFHFQSQHFLFWKAYLFREGVAQNDVDKQLRSFGDFFWYIKGILINGHLVSLLGIAGIVWLRKKASPYAVLILGEILIHTFLYGISSRHYAQYVIPVFPWFSFAAGVFLQKTWPNVQARTLTLITIRTLIVVFVVLDIIPLRVHSGNETGFRPMTETLNRLGDNKNVYFYGHYHDQGTWEGFVGYIMWYWNRDPLIKESVEELYQSLLDDPKATAVIQTDDFVKEDGEAKLKKYPKLKVCLYNDLIYLITEASLCPESVVANRPRELPKQVFAR